METDLRILSLVLPAMGGSTVVGMLGGLAVRRIPHRMSDMILGFSAGVMLAAAVFGLITPAFEGESPVYVPVLGVIAGALMISVLDRFVPHLHRIVGMDGDDRAAGGAVGKTLLFVAAIALHKIPEGLAAGVSFGAESVGDLAVVAGSVSLQNVPEAFVVVAPLVSVGVGASRVAGISLAIAAVSMASVVAGFLLVSWFSSSVAFLLASAGGAMLYVISDEMIPETHSHGYEKQATFALISGFLLVIVLQRFLENVVR